MFRVGVLKFLDSYSFLRMSLDEMAKVYNVKNKTLCPYEYLKMRIAIIINQAIQQFKTLDCC